MLQLLRNKAQSIVIQALVVIIALVFIFWGVGTNLMNNREAAIVVNDEEISFQDYQNAYDRIYNNLRSQFGGNVPQGLLESFGIKDQVVNQLIQEALLRQGAAEMGIHASREEVKETVENMVQFQENGRFNIEKYESLLAANGFSPHSFEKTMALDMLAQKTRLAIGEFASTVTEYEIEDLHKLEKSAVAVKYVAIQTADYLDMVKVDDKELAEWYATVQDDYRTDPQIKLSYLDFSYDNVGEKITIDNEAVEQHYRDNIAAYTDEEKRGARHILLKADENSPAEIHEQQKIKAAEILNMARQGADFAELATKYSEGPSQAQGGDLGLFSRGQMVKPFEDAAFSVEEGGISDVVKTSFGYHIIKVEKILPPQTTPLEEVRDSILAELRTEQAKPLAFQVANDAYEGIIAAGSLEAYLKENPNVEVKQTEFFTREHPPKGLAADPNFIRTAFALKEKELSSLIETSKGYAILFADEIKPPQVPAMSEVREQLISDYKDYKAKNTAEETARSLLQTAREAQSLEKAAEKGGFTVTNSGYLKRDTSQESSVPRSLIEAAFKLTPGEPLPDEPLQADSTLYVYAFADRKLPEGELSEEEKTRYREAIIERKQQQILSGWLANRREQAKIFTHKSL
jgi:peptidyl-prolyl cis-trans isomerase D